MNTEALKKQFAIGVGALSLIILALLVFNTVTSKSTRTLEDLSVLAEKAAQ